MARREHDNLEDLLKTGNVPDYFTGSIGREKIQTLALCRIADELHELNETLRNSNL